MIKVEYTTRDGAFFVDEIRFHTFSGGEQHVNLGSAHDIDPYCNIVLHVACYDAKTVMNLLLVTDALRRLYSNNLILKMLYLPYARQDRACVIGDAFSLEVFANIINSQNYAAVYILDPHSDVASNLIHNVIPIPQTSLVRYVHSRAGMDVDYIVAPDKGAKTKTENWCELWNQFNVRNTLPTAGILYASKIRNTAGHIIATEIDCEEGFLRGATCLIVDDICDGGRTFTELAKVLTAKGAARIFLYVTHGIFSQGTKVLFDSGIERLYTTDTFPELDDGRTVVKRFYNY